MNAKDLLHWAAAHDVRLTVTDGELHVSAPAGVVTDRLRECIRASKSELLTLLRSGTTVKAGPVEPVGGRARDPAWLADEALAGLDSLLANLVSARPGWTPAGWANYLRQRADNCCNTAPHRARLYQRAADLIEVKAPTCTKR